MAKTNIHAVNDADQFFTVDTEPAAMPGWRDAFSDIPGDVQQWFDSDTGSGYDPPLQAKVEVDFAAADQQAGKVAAGQ